jgi:hypothetical protein
MIGAMAVWIVVGGGGKPMGIRAMIWDSLPNRHGVALTRGVRETTSGCAGGQAGVLAPVDNSLEIF